MNIMCIYINNFAIVRANFLRNWMYIPQSSFRDYFQKIIFSISPIKFIRVGYIFCVLTSRIVNTYKTVGERITTYFVLC